MKQLLRTLVSKSLPATCGAVFLALSAAPASAWPSILNQWQALYPSSQSDTNASGQGCMLCHVEPNGGQPWNPYGWEIRQRIPQFMGDVNAAILASAPFDSDRNPKSWSNLLEITLGTQPGWTPGPNNVRFFESSVTTGHLPDDGLLGSLDPAQSPMVPICEPGAAGVAACPCANPAAGYNRGCDNSSGTTGAALTATGTASLGADSLLFGTAGERANALSIVLQGNSLVAAGTPYGQGVRCVGGQLRRLYNRFASASGTLSVPDAGAGDPSVSQRSADLGDVIAPGESRWYLVYYRDPTVLGSCAPTTTFNATQTGLVDWQP